MADWYRKFSAAYLAGALGGLAYALAAWACGYFHVFQVLHAAFRPPVWSWEFVSNRLMLGSLWALLFIPLVPLLRPRGYWLGLIVSLIPSAYVLFFKYPALGAGVLSVPKGFGSVFLILLFNAAWGLVSGMLYTSQVKN